ncbi:MAG: PilW family protein [Syntrophomonadaceae bacterium]|jgi:prepilin-type N-terminal cleavage/methylation domain-containing protein
MINRKKKLIYDSSGMTIIELLIAIALVLIVAGLSQVFYSYTVNSYDNIAKQANLQQSVRLALTFIESRIKFANHMEIVAATPDPEELESRDEGTQAIYLDENGVLKAYKEGETQDLIGVLGENISLSLAFTKASGNVGGKLLIIEITGTDDEKSFSMNSELYLANLGDSGITGDIGAAIIFTLPQVSIE